MQKTVTYQLQKAAESEVLKASASSQSSESDIMREAEDALDALETLILDENMEWKDNKLGGQLGKRENLVQHRNRVLEMYY